MYTLYTYICIRITRASPPRIVHADDEAAMQKKKKNKTRL